jgi:hypothetical protein
MLAGNYRILSQTASGQIKELVSQASNRRWDASMLIFGNILILHTYCIQINRVNSNNYFVAV